MSWRVSLRTLLRCFAAYFASSGDPTLTREEKNHAMTYRPGSNLFERSYISKISIVDGQALFLREDPQRDHINLLRSAGRCRVTALPQKLPAQIAREVEESPQMVELSRQVAQMESCSKKERGIFVQRKVNVRKEALKKYQDQCVIDQYHQHVLAPESTAGEGKVTVSGSMGLAEEAFQLIRRLMPERSRLADQTRSCEPCDPESRVIVLKNLVQSCCDDERVIYRPNERPIGGFCPVKSCGRNINEYVIFCM